jgi:hypothetical protein
MTPITDYTTYDEVRAALGVSVDEIEDATLELDMYASALAIELEDIGDTLPGDFATIDGTDPSERTDAQKKVHQGVKAFVPYALALQLASSVPLFAPKAVSDGKATVTRDSGAPYKAAIERCEREYARFKTYLSDRYGELKQTSGVATQRPFLNVSSPTSDPVAGT